MNKIKTGDLLRILCFNVFNAQEVVILGMYLNHSMFKWSKDCWRYFLLEAGKGVETYIVKADDVIEIVQTNPMRGQ